MPAWQPEWSDVRFDRASAQEAAQACRRAARLLTALDDRRGGLADDARREWRGRFRDDFDRDSARQRRQAERLVAALLAQAERIDAALAEADRQQHRREQARAAWREEEAAERADRDG